MQKPCEFVVAVAFADAEIEPSAGQKIDRGRLLGEEHRVVPGQDQDGGAEPQRAGSCREPGQQREAGGNLPGAGEMMLDQKGRVIAERLGFDVVIDELFVTEARVDVGPAAARGGAAK